MYFIWHEMFDIVLVSVAPVLAMLLRPPSREGFLAFSNRNFSAEFIYPPRVNL